MNSRFAEKLGVRLLNGRGVSDEAIFSQLRPRTSREFRSRRGFGYQRLRNEIATDLSTYREGWLYDTFSVAAGAAMPALTLMFQVPQGSGGKLLNSTNLTGQGGQVPNGQALLLRSIRIELLGAVLPDVNNIVGDCAVEFKVNQNPIWQATPEFFPAGFGPYLAAVGNLGTLPAGTVSLESVTNGMPVQTAVYEFQNNGGYYMESGLTFNLFFETLVAFNLAASSGVNPLGQGATIRAYLEGLKQAQVTT